MKHKLTLFRFRLIVSLFCIFIYGAVIAATQDQIVFFSDSPDGDELYDSSWGWRKAPSELELAGNNDVPVPATVR